MDFVFRHIRRTQDKRQNLLIEAKRTNYNAKRALIFDEAKVIGSLLPRSKALYAVERVIKRGDFVVWRGRNWWPGSNKCF